MNTPLFSIIIPVYNTESTLKRCLYSCINQDFQDIEIIVINNGSSGDVKSIVSEYPDIKYIENPHNMGVFEARRQGFVASTGRYIIHCDSDDWLEIGVIKKCLSYMEAAPSMIIGQVVTVYSNHKEKSLWANKGLSKIGKEDFFSLYLNRGYSSWAFWSKLIHRDIMERAYHILDIQKPIILWEDFLLFTTCAAISQNVVYFPGVISYYYINPKSFTQTRNSHYITDDLFHMAEVFGGLSKLQQKLCIETELLLKLKTELLSGYLDRISKVTYTDTVSSEILGTMFRYFPHEILLDILVQRQKIRSNFIAETFSRLILKLIQTESPIYNFLKRLALLVVKK